MTIKTVSTNEAQSWIVRSYHLFKKQPGILIAFLIIQLALEWIVGQIPMLGFPVSTFLSTIFSISWLLSAQKLNQDQPLKIEDLFLGFKFKFAEGIIYTLIYLFLIAVFALPVVFTVGFEFIRSFFISNSFNLPEFSIVFLIAMLFSVTLYALLMMAAAFALPLICFENLDAVDAMKASFKACSENLWSLTWFGLLVLGLLVTIPITAFLSALIVLPMLRIAIFLAYKSIFTTETPRVLESEELSKL